MARHDRRPERLDLIVRNGTLVIPGVGQIEADVGMAEGKIAALGDGLSDAAAEVYDAAGRAVLPGSQALDRRVHRGRLHDGGPFRLWRRDGNRCTRE